MLPSNESATERRVSHTQFSKRKTGFPSVLGLLKPIVDYSKREKPKYNYAKLLEDFTENLGKQIPLTELAEHIGIRTTKAPRFYDRRLHQSLFKLRTSKMKPSSRPRVLISLDEPLKRILNQQANFADVVIAFEDLEPYAELKIRLGDRRTYKEEFSEVEKALSFLVKNSSLRGISSLILKHHCEAYVTQKDFDYVSYTADFVQFNDKSQRFFEPIVYTEKQKVPSIEINGKPIQKLGFKVNERDLKTRHFKLPKSITLNKADIPRTISFMQHYYSVSSFRPLQVYSLKYSKKGKIPVCRRRGFIFLCFDFWLSFEASEFTMKWDERLPIHPVKEGFASVIAPEWTFYPEEERDIEKFKLVDRTREIGLETMQKGSLCEVKTKAGKSEEMQKLFIKSRVAKPSWRIRFKFTTGPQFKEALSYKFEGPCDNCPLLKA